MRILLPAFLLLSMSAVETLRAEVPTTKPAVLLQQESNNVLLARQRSEHTGLLRALAGKLWEMLFSPTTLARAMPNLVSFVPNLLGGVVTNILELVIDFTRRFVEWVEPSFGVVEVTGRMLSQSFLGRFLPWDAVDTGLRALRVPRSCRPRAACECGAYVLQRNTRVAKFMKALRTHFAGISAHWPAVMAGLRGDACEDIYGACSQSFIMAKTGTQRTDAGAGQTGGS